MLDILNDPQIVYWLKIFGYAYLVLIWLTMIIWTLVDSIKRSRSFIFQLISLVLVMVFNVLGLIVYLIIRPRMSLQDKFDEDLEREYMLKQTLGERCTKCKSVVEKDYRKCPVCTEAIREVCKHCSKLVMPSWRVCPYCGTKQDSIMKVKPISKSGKKHKQ